MKSRSKMEYLRVDNIEVLSTDPTSCGVTVARLRCDEPFHGPSDKHVQEAAFLLSLQLQDFSGDLWRNGRDVNCAPYGRGEFSVYDYREVWRANLLTPFDCVNFHIPIAAFESLKPELGAIDTLAVAAGASVADTVVHTLATLLVPHLASQDGASRLFVDQIELALLAHLAVTYGKAEVSSRLKKGGLTPFQVRLVTERIDAGRGETVTIAELAHLCGLSGGYFCRAFKRTIGCTPHQWVLYRRIEQAKALLGQPGVTLAEIAAAIGFADQAHFNRVFVRIVGETPGRWRRSLVSH